MAMVKTNWDKSKVGEPLPKKKSWLSSFGCLFGASRSKESKAPHGSSSSNDAAFPKEDEVDTSHVSSAYWDDTSVATSRTSFSTMTMAIDDTTINGCMRSELAELAASNEGYYEYPLTGTQWLEPTAKVMGQPAYIARKEKPKKGEIIPVVKDYAFGFGRYGYGHYHLMTQDSWKALSKSYKGKNSQVRRILKQRSKSAYRNDSTPNQIKFANKAQRLHMRSTAAKRAGYGMGSSLGAAACAM
ncbi:expressed unknown protein [Seminavis robusta]|uniref:Uncharacterized protein n=1 Tax=Seminavis robusta TaxID=568900 RepID=A0A9N8DLA2_9STRA|nr:expressed unknown protein [Seminavis robusta]|eukprot:Sro207_g086760.1 n/a (243) ;mRNA; r:12045-12773